MDYRGIVDNGVIRPSEPLELPNGTEVQFHPVQSGGESDIERSNREFWASRPLEELLKESGARPIESIDELAVDWPEGDDIDEFLRQVRQGRQ